MSHAKVEFCRDSARRNAIKKVQHRTSHDAFRLNDRPLVRKSKLIPVYWLRDIGNRLQLDGGLTFIIDASSQLQQSSDRIEEAPHARRFRTICAASNHA